MNLPVVNDQPPAPKTHTPETIELIDIWDTFQGEGPFVGLPATFVRLAHCNLKCPQCDTNYTDGVLTMPVEDVVTKVIKMWPQASRDAWRKEWWERKLVVLTGGEPFRQDISTLAHLLVRSSFHVQIETNGTLFCEDLPWYGALTVVCSPKTRQIDNRLKPHVHALKYVLHADHVSPDDGLPTRVLGAPVAPCRPWEGFRGELFVNPEDSGDEDQNRRNLDAAMYVCRRYGYRLGIQLHKYIGVK